MRHIYALAYLLLLLLIASCGKDNASNDASTSFFKTTDQTLTLTLSKSQIMANGTEETTITVSENSLDVTSNSQIFVNGMPLTKRMFSTTMAGSYQFKATKGTLSSATVNLIAVGTIGGGTSVFTQKTLAEFYTGTWCGICPGTLIPMENYVNANPNTIMVGIHGPMGSGDPFEYKFDSQLRNTFSVSGVPSVVLNRNSKWDGANSSLDRLSQKTAPLGLAIETATAGGKINVTARVKFGSNISTGLKLVVMLVEDKVAYNQANYGHFGLPNPIPNFMHRNILRNTATDLYGDAIPLAVQLKDASWDKSFVVDATGFDLSRCRIVAFVVTAGSPAEVLNTQIVNAGSTQNFD